jgi:hypothetical protein
MYHGDIITNRQMKNFLAENSERKGFVKESHGIKRTLDKQKRCTVIDAYKLEKDFGIPVDNMD